MAKCTLLDAGGELLHGKGKAGADLLEEPNNQNVRVVCASLSKNSNDDARKAAQSYLNMGINAFVCLKE